MLKRLFKHLAVVASLTALTGCTVETATFNVPFQVEVVEAAPGGFVVIENINRPFDCRVVPFDAVYIAVYRQVFGPASRREAENFARDTCQGPRR